MSLASTSLDLSEFFGDDDSEGHRLVEFIQKKRGDLRTQNCLFLNYEPKRLSLKVQLEKIPCTNEVNNTGSESTARETNGPNNIQQERVLSQPPVGAVSGRLTDENPLPAVGYKSLISPGNTQNALPTKSPSQLVCSGRASPRISSIRKVCVSPSDRLRRYSLRRLTNLCGGRRTLLQEFENTLRDARFDPPLYSTPQMSKQQQKPSSPSTKSNEAENVNCSSATKNSDVNKSCCRHTDTLINSLERKDAELRNYIESVDNSMRSMQCTSKENNNTLNNAINKSLHSINSPVKRTYTEKVDYLLPGQVVLTPNKASENCQVKIIHLQSHDSESHLSNIQRGNISSSTHSFNIYEFRRGGNTLEISLSKKLEEEKSMQNTENASKTSQKRNTSFVLPMTEANQDQANGTSKSSNIIHSQKESNDTVTLARQTIQDAVKTNDSRSYQVVEDNLKLTDILTDDEDETSGMRKIENNSQAPLNLAKSVKKCLRSERVLRRKLKIKDFHLINLEKEAPKTTHAYNTRISKRRRVHLNRAPGIPLNGERFAKELAKMSNYEILDLRRRNSEGQLIDLLGQSQGEAMERKLHLYHEIENEINKRNLDNMEEKQISLNNAADIGDESNFNEHIPAPDEYRDSFVAQEVVEKNCAQSSFIDESPSDIISFKMNERKCQPNKRKKSMTEELKQYLEVSQILSRKKFIDKSKRSLYSQDQYENVVNNQSTEKIISITRSPACRRRSIPYVPSPPKSDDILITDMRIASPPSPFKVTHEKSISQKHKQSTTIELENISQNTNVDVIKNVISTPPQYKSDSNACIHTNNNNQFTTNGTDQTVDESTKISHENSICNTNNDMFVFKIPDGPAPRKTVRKSRHDKAATNDILESITESPHTSDNHSIDSTNGTLRRSKRGNVPLKQRPIFQILFERIMNKKLKYDNNKKQKERGDAKVSSKNNKTDTVESILSPNPPKPKKRCRKEKLPSNGDFISNIQQDAEMTNRKNESITKRCKTLRKPMNNYAESMEPNENLEHTSLILNTPATNEHNVYDQLKTSTVSTLNTSTQTSPPPAIKVKPFKINVARFKPLPLPRDRCDSESTASSTMSSSNYQLIPWLKSINVTNDTAPSNSEIFKEMRISAASALTFTQLQGVEYAFYDTDEKAFLGYLRFQPRQIKPKKRAKRFHLHFVAMFGNFRITANNKDSVISAGDMVAIEKMVYYDIENITDDIGILMVIKK